MGLNTGIEISKFLLYVNEENPPPARIAFPRSIVSDVWKSGDVPGSIFKRRWFSPSFQLKLYSFMLHIIPHYLKKNISFNYISKASFF